MLLKVKPDGPVYEVLFTSQLIGATDNCEQGQSVSTVQSQTLMQTLTSPRTVLSVVVSDTTVTSDCCDSHPVVTNLPPAPSSCARMTPAVQSDSSHMLKSDTVAVPLRYHHQPPFVDCNMLLSSDARRHMTANFTERTMPKDFAVTASAAHSGIDCR